MVITFHITREVRLGLTHLINAYDGFVCDRPNLDKCCLFYFGIYSFKMKRFHSNFSNGPKFTKYLTALRVMRM